MLVLRIGLKLGGIYIKHPASQGLIIDNLNTAPDVIDVISNLHKLPKKFKQNVFLALDLINEKFLESERISKNNKCI